MEVKVGDILVMKKKHPCGADRWQVLRIGQDLRLKCLGCEHEMMVARVKIEKSVKKVERGSVG